MKRILLSIVFMATVLWSVETVKGGITDVHTDPNEPKNIEVITIVVSGLAGSGGVWIDDSNFQVEGTSLELDIFITLGPYGGITPWSHSEVIGTLAADFYDLTVREYTYSQLTDTYELSDTYLTSFTVVPYHPKTYYVNAAEGSDNNDGLSPPTAFATIQKAIDSAFNGDTVLVADGTYTGPGNRDIDFLGKAITVRSKSGPENCIIDCNGTEDEPHRGFYFNNGEDANSILEGFTITRAFMTGRWPAERGGGIYCEDSSPTITNCTISGNAAKNCGGGVANYKSSPTITNCTFSKNSTTGGLSAGGGMFNYYSSPTLYNCWFSGNSAGYDGGGMLNEISSPKITKCTFNRNSTKYAGGCGGGMYNRGSSPILTNCSFSANAADGGGGINNGNSNPTLINCDFSGNSAKYIGGAVRCAANSSGMITNCTFAENSSPKGNALACDSSGQRYPSNLQLTNCILWDGGDEIWNNDGSTITITYSDIQDGYEGEGNIDAIPRFVEPSYWVDVNDPNIIVEPNDPNAIWVEGDYYLLPDSPCIDTGNPNYLPEPGKTDIDGNPRVIGGRIDMGAYESNYIQAAMKFTPQMLNCNSRGNWVKAHFVLPEGFLPEEVDVNEPAVAEPMGIESEYIKVLGASPVRLEITFDREAFCDSVTETGEVEVTVIGSLTTSRYFYATDTINIKPRR